MGVGCRWHKKSVVRVCMKVSMYVSQYVCSRTTITCDLDLAWESPNRFVVIVVVVGDF